MGSNMPKYLFLTANIQEYLVKNLLEKHYNKNYTVRHRKPNKKWKELKVLIRQSLPEFSIVLLSPPYGD
jgi:hypothetical protein